MSANETNAFSAVRASPPLTITYAVNVMRIMTIGIADQSTMPKGSIMDWVLIRNYNTIL